MSLYDTTASRVGLNSPQRYAVFKSAHVSKDQAISAITYQRSRADGFFQRLTDARLDLRLSCL